jgi:hypothetical protein
MRVSSQKESNVFHFQNIKEVIKIGNPPIKIEINYYIAILYTNLNDGKKEGFLVGNIKNMGDMLIGEWPYNEESASNLKELYLQKLDLLTNSTKFNNICVIYPLN